MRTNFFGPPINYIDPNICPHCHTTIKPNFVGQWETLDTDDRKSLISIWTCTNSDCVKLFVALYRLENKELLFSRFLNGLPKGPNWPQPIKDLVDGASEETDAKSKFTKTYLQSLRAESDGLDELAGMGYRKAIEYLVKDWAIKNNPDDRVNIKQLWLGKVIGKYYEGDLKDILDRAVWLGNDQAHYLKLFEEYDLDTLKELIDIVMVEIDRKYKTEKYIAKIEPRK